jgi:homocitrate synthase NifV
MNMPTWLDQTLNMAINRQFVAEELAELAAKLAALGLGQSVISLDGWQRHQPNLAAVQKCLRLYGLLALPDCNLQLAQQAGIEQVMLVCSLETQEGLAAKLHSVLPAAQEQGLKVSLLFEVAGVFTESLLAELAAICRQYSIAAIGYWDKSGQGTPFVIHKHISMLKSRVACPVGIAAGNTYGLATANTLAALKAGAGQVMTAVGGIGGHASWEEVFMAAREIGGLEVEVPRELAGTCQQIFAAFQLPLAVDKAIIGPAIFAHESGMHVDGVSKMPEIYEPFAPELVGLTRKLVVGKHSGTATLRTKFAAWGISLEEEESQRLLAGVRSLAVRKKTAISDNELRKLYLSG